MAGADGASGQTAELLELFSTLRVHDNQPSLKQIALQHIMGLTVSGAGRALFRDARVLSQLVGLVHDADASVVLAALQSLINLAADTEIASLLLSLDDEFGTLITFLLKYALQPDALHADSACKVLSNVSNDMKNCTTVAQQVCQQPGLLKQIVDVFCQEGYNKKGQKLDYLAPLMSNLTQITEVRQALLAQNDADSTSLIQRLLPFTQYPGSIIRRGGVAGTIGNCCFETDKHEYLMSEAVDMVSHLLLPLAGPEQYPDDVMDKLPVDLQYLPESKTREEDPIYGRSYSMPSCSCVPRGSAGRT